MAQVNKPSMNGECNGNWSIGKGDHHQWLSGYHFDHDSLIYLENLTDEFFSAMVSNERKRQIEVVLSEFSRSSNSWQMAFVYFEHTSNEYTKIFCMSVIESFVGQRWHTIPSEVRCSFRTSLWNHLVSQHAQMTPPVRNKLVKIIVVIAKFDWLTHYPDFMTNILDLLSPNMKNSHNVSNSTTLILLGLNLLGTAVEEMTNSRHHFDCHFSSHMALVKMLETNLPHMLQALTLLLEVVIFKHVHYYSATPPPSPTNNTSQQSSDTNEKSNQNSFGCSNLASGTLGNLFQMSLKKGLFNFIPEMDQEFVNLTSQIFACFLQIISFMPASYYNLINSTLLSALYVLATFGSINPTNDSSKLGLFSMNCVNELMSKASVFNSEANEFIYNVFHNIFLILETLVKSPMFGKNNLDEIDEDYLKKFIDFSKLFINGHLARFEKFIVSFPIKDFLQILFQFTTKMHHYSLECYLMLLDTWSIYLDYLENMIQTKHKDKASVNEKLELIKEPMFSLLMYILRSVQYQYNREYFQKFEGINGHCTTDDDNRTDLENFIHLSIEIIAKLAEIYPDDVISYIDSYYNEMLQNIYYGLEFLVNNNKPSSANDHHLLLNGSNEKNPAYQMNAKQFFQRPFEQLKLTIQDFITMLQVFSRFSSFFVDYQFQKYFSQTKLIFDKLREILSFIEGHKFDDPFRSSTNPLFSEFLQLKAQIIATYKAYIVWFQQICVLGAESSTTTTKQMEVNSASEHVTIIFNTCCSIICDTLNLVFDSPSLQESGFLNSETNLMSQKKMFHSAALTLNTFSSNVRPSFVFNLSSVQQLFDQNFQNKLLHLSGWKKTTKNGKTSILTDQILITQSISNLLILPWFQVANEQQDWKRRSLCLNVFVGIFLQSFNKLDLSDSGQNDLMSISNNINVKDEYLKCSNVYCRSLYILKQMIKSHSDSPLKSKQMLLLSLNSSLEAFIQLLVHNQLLHTTTIGCQITGHVLALFIVIFNVLLAQIHIDFVKKTIQTLLQIIHRHDVMSTSATHSSSNSSNDTVQQFRPTVYGAKELPMLRVIIKFFKLLILIIKQTSFNSALRSLLPDIIDFTVIHIQTNLINDKSAIGTFFQQSSGTFYDIYHKLLKVYYHFIYELLINNCRYFFPQTLANTANNNSSSSNLTNNNQNVTVKAQQQRYFDSVMEIFGESFLKPDNLQLYKQNVEALEALNVTIKLYWRPAFREKFWERFLFLFMQTLLDHSLELLDELLFTIVYHLAEVDFHTFYESFVPKFISNLNHRLTKSQQMELIAALPNEYSLISFSNNQHSSLPAVVDLPTFISKINRLLCDIRFFYKCNT